MYFYNVKLAKDGATVLATCRELPEVASVGDSADEALSSVAEAIELAVQCRINDREVVPLCSKQYKGCRLVRMPARVMLKAQLHNEMLAQGVRKTELARRLDMHPPQVDRILNVRNTTRLDTLEQAFAVLGRHCEFRLA